MRHLPIKLNVVGKYHCYPGWVWDRRREGFPDYDLWHVVKGRGRMTIAGRTFEVEPADCFLIPPQTPFHAETDPDAPFDTYYAHFDLLESDDVDVDRKVPLLSGYRRGISDSVFFTAVFRRCLESYYQGQFDLATNWLEAALWELRRQDEAEDVGGFSARTLYFKKLMHRINEYPERKYVMKKIAAEAGYSPEYFSRMFKTHAGMSFRECVSQARINRAKQLLTFSNHSMQRVAEICGYPDMYLFSRQFKRGVGMPPSKYRAGTV